MYYWNVKTIMSKFRQLWTKLLHSYSSHHVVNHCQGKCKNSINLIRFKSFARYLDYSKVPELKETDLVEQFVRGSGPGGQATNTTNNAVVLKHLPTGLSVKCHETRSLTHNRKVAREMMIKKLDNLLNKEDSIANQEQRLQQKVLAKREYKKKKLEEMKRAFKEREGLT